MLRPGRRWPLFPPLEKRGCSSVVEHLLAKEDVASSSLVTRSSLRLERERKAEAGAVRRSLGEGGRASLQATAGRPASEILLRNTRR